MNLRIETTRPASDRRRWIALVVVCLGQLMTILDTTIVNVALPSIQRDLSFTQANLTWVVNAYLITYGSFLLMAGRVGDLVGRKKVFLSGVVLFTAASALCGLAHDQALLIAARSAQGLGGALSSSVIVALIVTEFREPAERAQAMSIFTFVAIGLVTLLLGVALIDENEGIGLRHGVDVLGSVLVTGALMIGVYAIVTSSDYGWVSAHTLGLGGIAVAVLVAFVALEARLANPILPLRILRLRSLIGSSAARGVLVTGMYAAFFLGALYMEHVLGFGPVRTGAGFLPQTLVVGALSLGVTARLMRRFGPRRLLVPGLVAIVAGLALLSSAGEHSSYFPGVLAAYLLIGLGGGMSFMPLLTIAMAEVPRADAGLASGIVNVSVQVSGAIGVAALGTISADRARTLAAQGESLRTALTGGYHLGFLVAAACVAVCLLVVLVVLRSPGGAEGRRERPDGREVDAPAA